MKKMEAYILFVVSGLIGFVCCEVNEPITSDFCAAFLNKCECIKGKEYEVQCPSSQLDVLLHLIPDRYINIDCFDHKKYTLDILPHTNTNVESMKMRFCQLPLNNFNIVLEKFNVTQLKRLTLDECELGNKSSTEIDAEFFEGLSVLDSLSISFTSKTFGQHLFESFPNLVQLYLEQNKLTEIGYMFEKNPKLKVLHLSRNLISVLPDGIFKQLVDLQELHLWKNHLANITSKYFVGLKKLKSLELSINSIVHVEENSFFELAELVNISLKSNKIKNFLSNTFKNNLKLENVRLGDNPDLILEDYVFANLPNLKTITLNLCNLQEIPQHVFENSSNIKLLDLQNNKLQTLPWGIFSSLVELDSLILSKNQLISIPGKLFSTLQNLINLDLSYNQLAVVSNDMFEGLRKLQNLNLQKNDISVIDVNAFAYQTNLIKLDLSFNQWNQFMNAFSSVKCKQLLLNHNKFSEFPENILNSFINLKKLDLSYNNIEIINVKSFINISSNNVRINLTHNNISTVNFNMSEIGLENVKKNLGNPLTVIDVTENPLVCGCHNYELIQYLHFKLHPVHSLMEIKVDDTMCFAPKDFKHIPVSKVLPKHILCEVSNIDCPSKCKCYMRPADSTLIVDCSAKNLTMAPEITLNHQRIEVNLTRNFLKEGPNKLQGYENVVNLYLNDNKLNSFNYCPPKIENLKLDHNKLEYLTSGVLKTLEMSKNLSGLTLGNNSWRCECSALSLQKFIRTYFNQTTINDVVCADDNMFLVEKKELCKPKAAIVAQIVIPILIFFFIVATATALYFRYKREIKVWLFSKNLCLWFITEKELDKDKKYDIFLSFSHKDEDFVIENLIHPLEKANFILCVHSRDWIPGEPISEQIVDSVYNSRRTLIVLSDNFLESVWGKLEFLMAHKRSLEEGRPRVILVKLGDLTPEKVCEDLRAYIKTNTYVEWGYPWFWKKLLEALPESSKNVLKTNQKHANMMLKIDDKFELVSQPISYPDSTPPVISVDSIHLKEHPLNFASSNLTGFRSETPLIQNT